eukprot:gene6365-10371_t
MPLQTGDEKKNDENELVTVHIEEPTVGPEPTRERRPTVRDSVAIGLYDKNRRYSMRRKVEELKYNGMDYYQAKDCISMWKVYLVINCFIYWFFTLAFIPMLVFSAMFYTDSFSIKNSIVGIVIGSFLAALAIISIIASLISLFTFFSGFRRCYSLTKAKRWMLAELKQVVKEYKAQRNAE